MREDLAGAGLTIASIEVVGEVTILLIVAYVLTWMAHVYRSRRGQWLGPLEYAASGLLHVSAAIRFSRVAAKQVWAVRGRYAEELELALRRVQ